MKALYFLAGVWLIVKGLTKFLFVVVPKELIYWGRVYWNEHSNHTRR